MIRITTIGIGIPTFGIGIPKLGIGIPKLGIGIPKVGIGIPKVGIQTPSLGFESQVLGFGISHFFRIASSRKRRKPRPRRRCQIHRHYSFFPSSKEIKAKRGEIGVLKILLKALKIFDLSVP